MFCSLVLHVLLIVLLLVLLISSPTDVELSLLYCVYTTVIILVVFICVTANVIRLARRDNSDLIRNGLMTIMDMVN